MLDVYQLYELGKWGATYVLLPETKIVATLLLIVEYYALHLLIKFNTMTLIIRTT